ncbi:MAG: filamentous hemagglutinin N-terminal domain-containing protein, partial [Methylobacillus sp.]|jgi:filamentous hemagglutinin family protein|nr:filamentous hemagglutinin N-terminal domain-containing protein [Methylobacillus sp.]
MTINQSTNRAAINWNTFNIGQGYTVQFNQPGTKSITLNRVVGGVPSNIQGSLLANGQVWIQNANGVLFGSGATINVNSLFVTTKNIDVNQFMSGSNTFDLTSTGLNAGIINDGSITAQGYVTLVGDQVRNTGTINANRVILAAGDSATVALDNGQGINITLTNTTANALVENSGKIQTGNDGTVLLTAQGKDTLLNTVINLSGVVKAGTIVADANNTGDVAVTGKLDASNEQGEGGTVVLSGNRVGLFNDAIIDISGDTKGGTAIIGGDKLGKVPGSSAAGFINEVTLADTTQIDSGVKIDAGSAHGDGGFIETSGKNLSVQGTISAAAPNGKAGLWLIDPTDLTISTGGDGNVSAGPGTFEPTGSPSTVNNTTIQNALVSTDVLITTLTGPNTVGQSGNITQDAGADITSVTANNLTMEAAGNITLNGNISLQGGDLELTADADDTGDGAVTVSADSTIALNGGNLTIWGNTTGTTDTIAVLINGNLTGIGSGTITGNANDGFGIALLNTLDVVGGNLNITGKSVSNIGVAIYNAVTVESGGNLNITGETNSGQVAVVTFGTVSTLTVSDGNAVIRGTANSGRGVELQGDVTVNGDGVLNITGTTNTGAFGISVRRALEVTNGEVTLNGTANTDHGVELYGAIAVSDRGSLNITGKSDADLGIVTFTASTLTVDDGEVTLNGTSNSGRGIELEGAVVVDIGSLNITGKSDGDIGFAGYGALTVIDGNAIINGTSSTGDGVYLDNDLTVVVSGGSLNITGESASDIGVSVLSTLNATDGGVLNIRGDSTSGTGVQLAAVAIEVDNDSILNITGESDTGIGVQAIVDTAILANIVGNMSITGVSRSDNYGVRVDSLDPALVISQGNITLNGTSASNTGLFFDDALTDLTINDTGNVTLEGHSSGDNNANAGVDLSKTATVVAETGSLNIIGNAVAGIGAHLGDFRVSDTGNVSITGTSTDGGGVRMGDINTSGNSKVTANGTSDDDLGTGIDAINISDSSSVDIRGNSDGAFLHGVEVFGNIALSGGNLTVNGTASGAGEGIWLFGNSLDMTGGNASFNGTSVDGYGVDVFTNITASAGSNLTINGESDTEIGVSLILDTMTVSGGNVDINGVSNDFRGVSLADAAVVVVNDGSLDITGISDAGRGVSLGTGNSITVNDGDLNITGKSDGNNYGVVDFGKLTVTGGNANINGTSNTSDGVAFGDTVNVSGGDVMVNGTSNTGIGVYLVSVMEAINNGNLSVNGISASGTGVNVEGGSILLAGASTFTVDGRSASGAGISLDGTLNTTSSNAAALTGESTDGAGILIGGGTGFALSGNGTLDMIGNSHNPGSTVNNGPTAHASIRIGNLTVSEDATLNAAGNTDTGDGVKLLKGGTVEVADNGILNLTGTATTTGDGADLNGDILLTGNAKLTITGSSVTGNDIEDDSNFTSTSALTPNIASALTGTVINGGGEIDDRNPPSPGGGGGGGGGGAGAALGAAAVGGLIALLAGGEDEIWALETPQALTGDSNLAPLWCNAMLDYVEISADQKQAFVRLHTQEGLIERTLPLKEGSNGTKHYGVVDNITGEYAELSFNSETQEYFFQESGTHAGQPYAVKSHGWLGKKENATDPTKGNYELSDEGCAVPPAVVETPPPPPPTP